MSTWFTCKECKKSFEYGNDDIAATLKEQLGDQPFVCGQCAGAIPPFSKADVIDPETGEEVRETHQYKVPTPDVVLIGADTALIKRIGEKDNPTICGLDAA